MAYRLNTPISPYNLSGSTNQVVAPLSDIPSIIVDEGNVQVLEPEIPLETPLETPMGVPNPLPFNINLNKEFYGYNSALEELDEEFIEFNVTKYTNKDFFNLFDRFFYNLQEDTTLSPIMGKSGAYIGGYINPRDIEISNLNNEINQVQDQIDSIENEHPYFKNGKIIAKSIYKDNASAAVNEGNIYYMQTGLKRQIQNKDVYRGMKNRLGRSTSADSGQTSDQDFIIFIDDLNSIPSGPPIINFNDIYTPPPEAETDNITLYLNRFNNIT